MKKRDEKIRAKNMCMLWKLQLIISITVVVCGFFSLDTLGNTSLNLLTRIASLDKYAIFADIVQPMSTFFYFIRPSFKCSFGNNQHALFDFLLYVKWGLFPVMILFSTYAKVSNKLTCFTPWYAHLCLHIRGSEMLTFGKFSVRIKWLSHLLYSTITGRIDQQNQLLELEKASACGAR